MARVCKALEWIGVGVKLTVHDALGGYLVCGGLSFYPHARPGAEPGVQTSSLGLRVQGCQCTNCLLSCFCWRRRPPAVRRPRLRAAPPPGACPPGSPWRRLVVATRRACQRRVVMNLCYPTRPCARRANSMNTVGRSKHELDPLFCRSEFLPLPESHRELVFGNVSRGTWAGATWPGRSPQSGLGEGCKLCSNSKKLRGLSVPAYRDPSLYCTSMELASNLSIPTGHV
jgi:hypothetical protein